MPIRASAESSRPSQDSLVVDPGPCSKAAACCATPQTSRLDFCSQCDRCDWPARDEKVTLRKKPWTGSERKVTETNTARIS